MVYSGYNLVYGVHILTTKKLIAVLKNFCYGSSLNILIKRLESLNDERYEQEDLINKFLTEEGYQIQVHRKRCCYDDGCWYLGYDLGSTEFVYRDCVEEFRTFSEYSNSMQEQLDGIEKKWTSIQTQVRKELQSIKKLYNSTVEHNEEFDKFDEEYDLGFHKYANDCESCS